MLKRCNECGGEYSDTTQDGGRYFHACPPRVVVRVKRGDGSTASIDRAGVLPTDAILEERLVPRDKGRNENPVGTGDKPGRAIAEGAGATEIAR